MVRITISPAAESDILSILAWTHANFGDHARVRYEALLVRAIKDVAENPNRVGCKSRSEIRQNARTYHLEHSRKNVDALIGQVNRPRHFLIFRFTDSGQLELGRVLHDSMDLASNLPPEFLDDPAKDETRGA